MRTQLKFLWICAWVLLLSACKAEPDNRPPHANISIQIEAPDHFFAGQKTEIKLTLLGSDPYSINGRLNYYFIDGPYYSAPVTLSSTLPQASVSISIPLSDVTTGKKPIKLFFSGNGSDTYAYTTEQQLIDVYAGMISQGPSETIKAGSVNTLTAAKNVTLERALDLKIETSWAQLSGVKVALTPISDRAVEFTAPEVNEITQLRFSLTGAVDGTTPSEAKEKNVFIIPADQWVGIIKTFDDDSIIVREDYTALIIQGDQASKSLFKLPRPLGEIKDMAYLGANKVVILYPDGTVDLLVLNSDGTYSLPYESIAKSPILPSTYYTERYFFTANNIESINGLNHDGIWEAEIRWEPGTKVDSFYTLGARNGEYTTISNYGVSPALNSAGQLSGKLQNRKYNHHYESIGFLLNNIKAFGSSQYGARSASIIGYIQENGVPGFIEYAADAVNPAELTVRNVLLDQIPLQPRIAAIRPLQDYLYLIDEKGHLSRYHEKTWEPVDYWQNLIYISDKLVISQDGTGSIFWHDTQMIDYVQQDAPSTFNLKTLPAEDLSNL